jgi:acyl-CoA hydrolase
LKAGSIIFPAYFSEMPDIDQTQSNSCRCVFSLASPMDEHGFFSLALAADYTMAAIEKARRRGLEVNPNVPFANGNCHIHISQVRR